MVKVMQSTHLKSYVNLRHNANLTQVHNECRKNKTQFSWKDNKTLPSPQHKAMVRKKSQGKVIRENRQASPVTKSNPDGSCFKNTTLFPLNLPVRMISTVPGVMLDLQIVQNWQTKLYEYTPHRIHWTEPNVYCLEHDQHYYTSSSPNHRKPEHSYQGVRKVLSFKALIWM